MYQVRISYNMTDGKENECREYLVNKLAPGLAQLGFQFGDVHYTMWGNAPQIIGMGTVDDSNEMHRVFSSDEWETLAEGLRAMTDDLQVQFYRASEN